LKALEEVESGNGIGWREWVGGVMGDESYRGAEKRERGKGRLLLVGHFDEVY